MDAEDLMIHAEWSSKGAQSPELATRWGPVGLWRAYFNRLFLENEPFIDGSWWVTYLENGYSLENYPFLIFPNIENGWKWQDAEFHVTFQRVRRSRQKVRQSVQVTVRNALSQQACLTWNCGRSCMGWVWATSQTLFTHEFQRWKPRHDVTMVMVFAWPPSCKLVHKPY